MEVQCAGKGLRKMQLRVLHLDDSVHTFHLSVHATGQELYASMIERIHLLESDYFDLEYVNDEGMRCWLDHDKPVLRQLSPGKDLVFRFAVKFYTPYPNLLEEECTRYLFALQIKRDLVTGTLLCSENTAALLASYIVQAEIGDFIEDEYRTIEYLRPLKLMHEPTEDRLHRTMEYHKAHVGMSPSESDITLLDTARKVEFYGIRLHFARNHEGLGLNLAVSHLGILIFQNLCRISTFSWAKIRKLSFKRKRFLVKLQPERFDVIEFLFDSRDECKQFWKNCIEHHAFFRCPVLERNVPAKHPRNQPRSGSTFRYTGRTQQELFEYVQEHGESKISFERPSAARRAYSSIIGGSSYSSRSLNSASMQLRSSSADRRAGGSNNISVSLTNTLGRSSVKKRSQSEGARTSKLDVEEAAEGVSDGISAVPTSGYATMAESAGSERSGEAVGTGINQSDEPVKGGSEMEEPELDAITWINETYRRMTGDWTGSATQPVPDETLVATRRSKSTTGSPQTSGTISLSRLDTELDDLLQKQDQELQLQSTTDDEAVTRLIMFGDLTDTNMNESQGQNQQQPTPTSTPPTDRIDPTQSSQGSESEQHLSTDLPSTAMFVPDAEIANLVNLFTSPIRHQPSHEAVTDSVRSFTLSTTQPDLISQADSLQPNLMQRNEHRQRDWNAYECGQEPLTIASQSTSHTHGSYRPTYTGSDGISAVSTFLGHTETIQSIPSNAEFLGELGLRTQNTLFILPTVTQYGLDINMDIGSAPAIPLQMSRTPHGSSAGQPVAAHSVPTIAATFYTPTPHGLPVPTTASPSTGTSGTGVPPTRPLLSLDQRGSTMAASLPHVTYTTDAVTQPDEERKSLPPSNGDPDPRIYPFDQAESWLTGTARLTRVTSASAYSDPLMSSRSACQMPVCNSVTTVTYSFGSFAHYVGGPSQSTRTAKEAVQSLPVDQWSSSSGSESTTGVILRPDPVQKSTITTSVTTVTTITSTKPTSRANPPLNRQHRAGCPHSLAFAATPPEQFTATQTSLSSALPALPLNTLPARQSYHKHAQSHSCSHGGRNLSYSIPCGVHLSGLEGSHELFRGGKTKSSGAIPPGEKQSSQSRNPEKVDRTAPSDISQPLNCIHSHQPTSAGQLVHPELVMMGGVRAAADMLEEVPYVVLRRPRSVDVKQYQLHLQRQQQQAAALVAAGYSFHPGAPFYGEQAAYPNHHFGHRMPMFAHQFAYQQPFMPPCHQQDRHHRHHHHISSKALDESKYDKVSASSSKRLSSMTPVGSAARTDSVYRDPVRPSFKEHEHSQRDTKYPMECDLYAQPALIPYAEREKCKARRRHPKTSSETKVTKDQQPYSASVADTKPPMKPGSSGVAPRHHLHCVHRQPEADAIQRNGEHERKQSTSQTRRHLFTKTSTAAKVTDQMRPVPEHVRSQRRTPGVESPMSRYKRTSHQEPDDCRESEVPYPVSELFFSPHQMGAARDGRPVKSHGSSRHHQHHPACASLMGRTRPQLVEQESHRSSRAKASSHSAPLPVSSLPVGVDKTRDTFKSKTLTTFEATDRVSSTVQDGGKRTERTPEELNKDTRDTIEKLRQELRSAGFQVKDITKSNELPRTPERREPGAHRALSTTAQTTLTDANKKVHSRSTPRAAIARVDQMLTKGAPTADLAKAEPEKDKIAYTGTSATKDTVIEASKMTTNLDMMFGGPPRNPVYLNSDTDSCEEHPGRDGDQVAVVGLERGHKRRETAPVPSEKDYTDPLGLPTTDSNLEQSTDTGKLVAPVESIGMGPSQSAFSPRSHSPSLPLSFPLSDEQYDPTDISFGSQTSLLSSAASHKSESYCSECNRGGSYDSFSQTSSHSCCHSRQRRRGHRLEHCHYSHQPHFPSRSSSFCHACRSPHHHHRRHCHHRHSSDDRRYGRHHSQPHSHRSGRHHSERPRHNTHDKASSYTHKHGRSTSDKRRHQLHMSMSSSDQSEQSWTNSLTESSVSEAEEESKLLEIGNDGDTLDVKTVLNRIRTQERKLRAELAKHRNLANQLRQAQQRISKSAAQNQSAEDVVASEKDLSMPKVKSQKHNEKVLLTAKDKKPEWVECTPSSQIGGLRKKRNTPCKRLSGKTGKPFSLENETFVHKSLEKKEEKESAKSLHHVTRKLRHYRSHHHAPSVRKSIIPKTGGEMKTRVEIDDTVVTLDTADDGDVNFDEDGLIIANTEALRGAEPDVDVTPQETKTNSDQLGLTSKIMLATFELEDISEAAVSDEKVELGPNVMLLSTTEPQTTCALTTLPAWTQYEVTSEADRVGRTEIISQAPTPPSSPPPSTFLVTSTPHDSPAKFPLTESVQETQSIQELDEIEEQQSGHITNVRWSSTNQLTELGLNEEISDGDSEYDGTRAINMLSEVIENALSFTSIQTASPDLHENSITDGSTQASSVCDDTHTSEASADTIKQAHSPRTVSPSCSSSSASEGSEEIEPFPPPPPESLIDVFATHETPLPHSHHLFSTALDEVIEEEGRDMETENTSNDILLKAESENSQLATEALQTKLIIGNHDKESMSGSGVVEQLALIEELDISRRSELEPISEGGSVSSEVEQDDESLNLVLSVALSDVHRGQQTDDEESTEVTTEVVQLSNDGFPTGIEESHEGEPAQVQLTETNGVTHLDGTVDADMPSLSWSQQQDQVDSNVNPTHSMEPIE